MKLIVAALLIAANVASAQELQAVKAPTSACESLKQLRLPDVRITEITNVQDSVQRGDNVRGAHCRVGGVIGRSGVFMVMLPNNWNQRLLMGGNGGFAGTLNRGILAYASTGYVTVTTNTGHEAPPNGGARWALNDPELQLDFAYVAVHRAVEVAKSLAHTFYGSDPKFSYFTGCSNGGRQAMMEVQRYPEDFDGVVAGAPAMAFTTTGAVFLRNLKASFPDQAHFARPVLTQESLDLLSTAVLAACDAIDGVSDGVLDDPRECQFKLSSLKACPGNKAARDCLTREQRAVIAAIQSPLMDEHGKVAFPGQPLGGENLRNSWQAWTTGSDTGGMRRNGLPNSIAMFVTEGGKYITYGDSTWDYSKSRGSDYLHDSRPMGAMLNAENADINRFAARNGKVILWHGWNDPAINPLMTIQYYEDVLKRDPKAREYVRLFMAPGVLHCGGGNGIAPSEREFLNAVVAWVEKGSAPEQLVAARRDSAQRVVRTRVLCRYPQRAVYTKQGSTDEASNFVCKEP